MSPPTAPLSEALPVVGIGGSAGSLEPLRSFLANLPAATGAAYIIITHHPSGERSLLPDILEPQTALPVQMVEEGEVLAPDRVYIVLPEDGWVLGRGQLVRIGGGRRRLGDLPLPEEARDFQPRLPATERPS